MRAVHTGQLPDRARVVAGPARRLVGEHVQPCPYALLSDRGGQGGLVDDLAARGVEEQRAGLHGREERLPAQTSRAVVERHMDADDIGRGSHCLGRRERDDTQLLGALRRETAAPRHDLHAEPLGPCDHRATDAPDPDQAERAPVQTGRLGVRRLVPAPLAQVDGVVDDAPVQRQHQPECQLGDSDRVLARAVGHEDASLRGSRHVDRVVAGPSPDHQRQRAGRQHLLRHLGAPHHKDLRPLGGDGLRKRSSGELGVDGDVHARGGQGVDTGLLERVSDEYAHDPSV